MDTPVGSPNSANPATSTRPEGAFNLSPSAHAAVDSIAALADEAARKAKPAIDGVAAMAHQAVDKLAGAVAPTTEWLTEHGESLKATQKKLVQDTSSYISTHPLSSVAIAAVAGFVLSRIIR